MTLNVSPADGLRQASSPPTERVIAIMEMLGAEPLRPFSLAEISRALDISRATGHAIMATLADHDWVSRDPRTAKYTWGAAISGLADARPFRAELEKLAATTGTQVYLAQREDSSLVIVEVVGEAQHSLRRSDRGRGCRSSRRSGVTTWPGRLRRPSARGWKASDLPVTHCVAECPR